MYRFAEQYYLQTCCLVLEARGIQYRQQDNTWEVTLSKGIEVMVTNVYTVFTHLSLGYTKSRENMIDRIDFYYNTIPIPKKIYYVAILANLSSNSAKFYLICRKVFFSKSNFSRLCVWMFCKASHTSVVTAVTSLPACVTLIHTKSCCVTKNQT